MVEIQRFADVAEVISQDGSSTKYTSLKDAVDAAKSGDTIKLLDDVTTEETVTINNDLTLNLNGHKLTSTKASSATEKAYVITVAQNAEFTLTDSSSSKDGAITGDYGVLNNGKFKMEAGCINSTNTGIYNDGISSSTLIDGGSITSSEGAGIINDKGKLTLKKGTISAKNGNAVTLPNYSSAVEIYPEFDISDSMGINTVDIILKTNWGNSNNNTLLESSNFIATNSADNLTLGDLATTKNVALDSASNNQLVNSDINYLNMNTGSNDLLSDSQLNKVTGGVRQLRSDGSSKKIR